MRDTNLQRSLEISRERRVLSWLNLLASRSTATPYSTIQFSFSHSDQIMVSPSMNIDNKLQITFGRAFALKYDRYSAGRLYGIHWFFFKILYFTMTESQNHLRTMIYYKTNNSPVGKVWVHFSPGEVGYYGLHTATVQFSCLNNHKRKRNPIYSI